MPQMGGHLIIAEKVLGSLGNPANITQNRNAYNLGAIGPDMPFFLFDVIGQIEVLNTVMDVYTTIRKIKGVLDETAAAILDPALDLANWFTGNLVSSVGDLIGLGVESLKNLVILTLLPGSTETVKNPFADVNYPGVPTGPTMTLTASDLSILFRRFGHPYSYDKAPDGTIYKEAEPFGKYDNWWWTDVLHYRRTSSFAKRLVDNAGNDPLLNAYATGYWTHIGADVAAHPYVNAVVGGPYREHVIRHMVQENIIDAWLWNHYKNQDIINAGLQTHVDVGGDLSPILRLLLRTMKGVYTEPDGPQSKLPPIRPTRFGGSTPSEADLKRAYQTMLLFLDLSTNCGITPPVPPPDSIDEVLQEVWNDITKSVEEIGESFGKFGWWNIFLWWLALFLAAMRSLNVLIKLITLPEATLVRLATLSPRWAIYLVQAQLYEYVMNARFALALSGFGRVSREDLIRPYCQLAVINNPKRAGIQNAFEYPNRQVPRLTQAFWLADPLQFPKNLLTPKSECSPYPPYADPSCFVDGPSYPIAYDPSMQSFASAYSPEATIDIQYATFGGPQFGNAVEFSRRLITGIYPPADFDLDSDYGYGFLGWDGAHPVYVKLQAEEDSMSDLNHEPDDRNTPDLFTRLSIAMCPQDDGTRPVNPTWAGSDISFLSPAIQFDSFPVPAGVPTQVKISIDNLGTIDASPVTLETAYNIYMGNQAATMVVVQNLTIPLIPAGYTYPAAVTWTPPDEFIAHACFHARVFDTYSMVHYGPRCFSWDPYINPQSGSHNTLLLKIADPQQAVIVTYPAINTSSVTIEPKLLVTMVDNRARFNNSDDRFPLPFVPEHLTSTSMIRATEARAAGLYPTDLGNVSARVAAGVVRGESGRVGRLTGDLTGRRWPREDVNARFIHHLYGFDTGEALNLAGGRPAMRRDIFVAPLPETVQLDSYCRLRLAPGEAKLVRVVIPPAEFPPPGRRKKFQVDYQTWDEHPVQNFIYLYG